MLQYRKETDIVKIRKEINMEISFHVKGMMCQHCEQRVQKAISGLDGVESCSPSAEKELVEVVFDEQKIQADAIKNAIEDTGYDVVE